MKKVFGVGINDADYKITRYEMIDGKQKQVWICPFYQRWKNMLERAYNKKFIDKCPTYKGVTVCEEWHEFSNFKAWMEVQDWEDKHLDKDLAIPGNRQYSPEACVFVTGATNRFVIDSAAIRGDHMIGVNFNKSSGKFMSSCKNPFTLKLEYLGLFNDETQAHLAWKKRKHELALMLADIQSDERVAEALRQRYK